MMILLLEGVELGVVSSSVCAQGVLDEQKSLATIRPPTPIDCQPHELLSAVLGYAEDPNPALQ
jgi:hypothetical protein